MKRKRDYGSTEVGTTYGLLTVVSSMPPKPPNKIRRFVCKCACGNTKIALVNNVRYGHTRSCGCMQVDNLDRTTHGLTSHRLYRVWDTMKQRCTNKNNISFKNYGLRGISVCDEWQDFIPFYEWCMCNGYAKGLDIDRINNDGNYEPSNCRFVTRRQNSRNTRQNVKLTFQGETKCIVEWAESLGISPSLIYHRLYRGWSVERALTEKKHYRGKKS